MDKIESFIKKWEDELNADEELSLRNIDKASTMEGRDAIQLNIEGGDQYSLRSENGKFKCRKGPSEKPLLCWSLPPELLREVLVGSQPVFYALLDDRGELSFDTQNFTHFNGASIIEMLYLAQEVVKKSPELLQSFQQPGG